VHAARWLTLSNKQAELTIDLDRGADVVSLIDRRTGIDVMFRTPWAERARAVAQRGSLLWHESSMGAWLESYAGGWQLLCPNAGDPIKRAGTTQGFHGEAAVVPWTLVETEAHETQLRVELHTSPLTIERTLSLTGPVVAIHDVVRNESAVTVELDYQHHPAFGEPLIAPGAVIETGARTFVADPGGSHWHFDAGAALPWPCEPALDRLPPRDEPRALLGWLTDFADPWAAIRNEDLDLGVAMRWNADVMPYAWLWQELHGTAGYPWYRRAYVTAIEPSSTTAGGPKQAALALAGGSAIEASIRLAFCHGRSPIRSVDDEGVVRV
jgi:hypothetical protein